MPVHKMKFVLVNPFELAIAWPKLTVDVASALFDSAWSNHCG